MDQDDFFDEAKIMMRFNHPNLIRSGSKTNNSNQGPFPFIENCEVVIRKDGQCQKLHFYLISRLQHCNLPLKN